MLLAATIKYFKYFGNLKHPQNDDNISELEQFVSHTNLN